MIEIYDNNKQKIECEILFTFNKDNKSFIVYKDKEDDILASYYKKDENNILIEPILDDNDYSLVDEELEKWWEENE